MSLPHFHLTHQTLADKGEESFRLDLSAADIHHLQVLRTQPNEHLAVVDAQRDYFEVSVVELSPEGCTVRIAQRLDAPIQLARVSLLQGMAKGDKMDDIVRHSTELGIVSIRPFYSRFTQVKLDARRSEKRLARWRAIAQSAARQAGHLDIPDVFAPLSLTNLLASTPDIDALLVCWEQAPADALMNQAIKELVPLIDRALDQAHIGVVVGAEGGLHESEVGLLQEALPSQLVSLGPTILRTETAALIAPALAIHEITIYPSR